MVKEERKMMDEITESGGERETGSGTGLGEGDGNASVVGGGRTGR